MVTTERAVPAGTPELREVVRIVREALHDEVLPATADRPQYVVRMACRLLDIVGRELDAGTDEALRLAQALARLGVADESELAVGVVDGRFDVDDAALRAVIDDHVRWRIAIARPEPKRNQSQGVTS